MRHVVLESPFAGENKERNIKYARYCVRDSLGRGEAPIASHLLYTQQDILNDDNDIERAWGIDAGLAWLKKSDKSVIYTDLGISVGMEYGINSALDNAIDVEFRTLPNFNKLF